MCICVGANIDAAVLLDRWIGQHNAFEELVHREIWLPTSPFLPADAEDAHRLNGIGELLRQDLRVRSFLIKLPVI